MLYYPTTRDSVYKQKVMNVVEQSIKWWCENGRDSTKALEWLSKNVSAKIGQHDNIALYIWIGTCDLTVKNKEYISIKTESDE